MDKRVVPVTLVKNVKNEGAKSAASVASGKTNIVVEKTAGNVNILRLVKNPGMEVPPIPSPSQKGKVPGKVILFPKDAPVRPIKSATKVVTKPSTAVPIPTPPKRKKLNETATETLSKPDSADVSTEPAICKISNVIGNASVPDGESSMANPGRQTLTPPTNIEVSKTQKMVTVKVVSPAGSVLGGNTQLMATLEQVHPQNKAHSTDQSQGNVENAKGVFMLKLVQQPDTTTSIQGNPQSQEKQSKNDSEPTKQPQRSSEISTHVKSQPERGKTDNAPKKSTANEPSTFVPLSTRKRSRPSDDDVQELPTAYKPRTIINWSREEKDFIAKYVKDHGGYESVHWKDCGLEIKKVMDVDRTASACRHVYLREVKRKIVHLHKKSPTKITGQPAEADFEFTVEDEVQTASSKVTVEVQTDITIGPWDHFAFACLKRVGPPEESVDKPTEELTLQSLLRGDPAPSPRAHPQASQKTSVHTPSTSNKPQSSSATQETSIPSASGSATHPITGSGYDGDLSTDSLSADPAVSANSSSAVPSLGDSLNTSQQEGEGDHVYSKETPKKNKPESRHKDNGEKLEGDLPSNIGKISNPELLAALKRIGKKPSESELSVINLLKLKVLIETKSVNAIAKGILTVPDLTNAVFNLLLRHEMEKVNRFFGRRYNFESVLSLKSYDDLKTLSMGSVAAEMVTQFPYLSKMVMSFMLPPEKRFDLEAQEALSPRLGMIYAIMGITRYKQLSRVQRFLTMHLVDQICDKHLYHKLNSLGVMLCYDKSNRLARDMGKPLGNTCID